MRDNTIINEFKLVNQRCDQLTAAVNETTRHVTDMILLVRAYENMLNMSWFMRLFLPREKVLAMMQVTAAIEQRIFENKELAAAAEAEAVAAEGAREKSTKETEKVVKKQIREYNKTNKEEVAQA